MPFVTCYALWLTAVPGANEGHQEPDGIARMEVGSILYLSFVAASICFAVTETRMFQGFREEIKRRNTFFGELVSCGYCLGHWVSGGLVVIYTPRLTRMWWPLDYLLSVLIIAWLSAFQWVLMCCLMQKAGK